MTRCEEEVSIDDTTQLNCMRCMVRRRCNFEISNHPKYNSFIYSEYDIDFEFGNETIVYI